MLRILGPPAQLCDRLTRREILRVGGLGALGVSLPRLLHARSRTPASSHADGFGKADACILIFLFGGPSQLDTFDMKPDAPSDFRGEFNPIPTNVPGIDFCEHFPRLARQTDKLAVLRSVNHLHPRHGYGLYYMFTGHPHVRPDLDAPPTPDDFPSMGALVAKLHGPRTAFPPAVTLPRWNRFLDLPNEYAGETAGFLGGAYDPWLIKAEPNSFDFHVDGVQLPGGVSLNRLAARRDLLSRLDEKVARLGQTELGGEYAALYQQAFALVSSPEARRAFDLQREDPKLRQRYGMHPMGQGMLMARRLVEAGACLITVNWHNDGSDVKSPFWDTHKDNFGTLKNKLIPPVDEGLAALLEDLHQRGLLESTLVVVMGEFGRTPKIGRVVMNDATDASGRDHWPHAYSVLLAGGPVRPARAFGATDERAAYVTENPVSPPDLVATVLHCLGIDPATTVYDRLGRPHRAAAGAVVRGLL